MEAYKQTVDTVTKEVSVNTETGLTQQEAQQRLKENGRNQFEEAKKDSVLKKFIHSLSDFTTIILLVLCGNFVLYSNRNRTWRIF